MPVGLVFVSHSAAIAEGLVELARQMAPTVPLLAAGGTDEGGIGTSYTKVDAAIRAADAGSGVLVIGDLGSAILTAETAVDLLDSPPAGGVRVLDVPLVEGGVAAAVAAESGESLDGVARAAGAPDGREEAEVAEPTASDPTRSEHLAAPDVAEARVVLTDPEGLHARPAAALVRAAAGFEARVTIEGANAASMLAVLALGLRHGAEVLLRAEGPDAAAALAAVRAAVTPEA
jgi:PTS hybrid protein